MQDFAFYFADLHEFPVSPSFQPAEGPLSGTTSTRCISHSSQVCTITSAKSATCLIVQVINEEVSQYSPGMSPWSIPAVADLSGSEQSMLTVCSYSCWLGDQTFLTDLEISSKYLDYLPHHFSRDHGQADDTVVPWVSFLALFEDRSLHVLRNLLQLP